MTIDNDDDDDDDDDDDVHHFTGPLCVKFVVVCIRDVWVAVSMSGICWV